MQTLYNLGNHTQAIALYNKALAIDPKFFDALVDKGKSLDSLGRHNEVIALYNKALTLDPKNADALNGKKQALARFKQPNNNNIIIF